MSLWARLTKPSISKEEAEEKYYFTTSSGQIVSADGSGYVIPALEPEEVEKQEYIPLDFAQQKVKSVTDEANSLRESYQKHLAELDSYYRKASTDSKTHYETLIKDLKAKALRHVEVRKQMQATAEQKLRDELKISEDSVEELRDSMASLNREYQEEVRSLKTTITEGIKSADEMNKELTTLRNNADQVESDVNNKHLILNTTRATVHETLLSICHTIEIHHMKENLHQLMTTNAQVSALQAEVLAVNEKNRICHEQLDAAEQERIAAAELQAQNIRDAAQLREEHTAELHNLALAHRMKLVEARREYLTQLERIQSRLIDSEVQNTLTDITHELSHQHNTTALSTLNSTQQASLIERAEQERVLIAQFEQQLQSQRTEFKTESDALRKKFNAKITKASDKIRAAEVSVVLTEVVLKVVEANTVVGSVGNVSAVPVVLVEEENREDSTALTVPLTEHQALLQKVQELEEAISANQTAFEAQLAAHKSGGKDGGSASTTTSGTPAEALHTELSEKLALLRSQEANLTQHIGVTSAVLAQHNSELEKINSDKEECKNDIKDWSRAFLEANGREPNVQDKATVKDKYQRYKVLGARAKEVEGKVGAAKADHDGQIGAMADVQQQIAQLLHQLSGGTSVTAGATAVASGVASGVGGASSVGAVNSGGVVGVAVPLPLQRPVVDTSEVAVQTEDRAAMLRKLNSQANLVTASTKVPSNTNTTNPNSTTNDTTTFTNRIAELELLLEQDVLAMETLDDTIYSLNSDITRINAERDAVEAERLFLQTQVDTLVKEKRTDIVKQYQDEILHLNTTTTSLNDKVAHLTAEKHKNEARIVELTGRADAAEAELKERDARELAQLTTAEEKALLKTQIAKQRDQITLKAKAATAGWDAAATSDERLDIETERAYKKGLQEERTQHIQEMHSLNDAIEIKENRITELLVSMSEMERRVIAADSRVSELNTQTEMLRLEVADTVASLAAMGSGGGVEYNEDGEVIVLPTVLEIEQARDQLDLAQEEIVNLMERCDRLEIDLTVAQRKNVVYEQLVAVTGISNADTAMKTSKNNSHGGNGGVGGGGGGSGSGGKKGDVNEIINIIKKAIAKGTNLWKSNRKDETYDVYHDACVECLDKLLTPELKQPVADAITNGRNLAVQNKQRGSVAVRKALDKLLSDLEKPAVRKAEEDAAVQLRAQAADLQESEDTQHNTDIADYLTELNEIENNYLEQGYTKENNPSNTAQDKVVSESASLLQRAKVAEAAVVAMKKQLAAVIAATAANNGDGGGNGGASTKNNTNSNPNSTNGANNNTSTNNTTTGNANNNATANRRSNANTGADPAEVRKLNRKIKDLELQLKNNTGGGGGGGDTKALQLQEKQLNKKIKDMETQYKRDSKNTEMRAVKAENALSKIESTYNSVVSERDRLKNENAKLAPLPAELAALKAKTAYFEQVEVQLDTRNKDYEILAEQFKKETTLRKKYKNELEDLKGAIRVYARCRPMAKYELERGCKNVVEVKDESSLKLITQRGEKDFEFDAVFGVNSTQDQVFEDTKRLVESCMDGFNVCLFAYGQTGSGKTFTMTGSASMPGLTPKAIDELYRHIDERPHCNIRVTTYFVELYNDNLVDLYFVLDNKNKPGVAEPPKLDIKMDAKKMVYIRNAVIKEANSPQELMDLFNSGNLERHTGATKMNAESSRSHSIFAIMVDSFDTATKRSTTGKLSLVDLAGSERADKTGAAAERLKEAQNINKSLSALGDVIAALSEGTKFIPYRNNKLTQLMQDSLGGNAKTLMFVNFSPADYNSDETSTSLMYAARVKKIVNNASKAAESEEVARLKQIIKRLQAGQPVGDLQPPVEEEDEGPPPADDPDKTYDGY